MSYLLKFEFSKNYIDDQLLPWKKQLDKQESVQSDNLIVQHQIGVAIKYSNNTIKIITPFFIHIPYSKCSILNTEITLQLVSYCYFTRLAVYTTNIKNIKEYIKFESIKIDLINLSNINIRHLDKSAINLSSVDIYFDNTMNDNIYPFVWLKSQLDNPSLVDEIITGLPIYSDDKFIGIIYNITNEYITIIPNINILLNLQDVKLSNIFIDLDINLVDNTTIIKQTYSNNLQIGDKINSINDQKINNQMMIHYDRLMIDIPINTYIWYQSMKSNVFKFNIKRDKYILNLNIFTKRLDKQISFDINDITEYKIINNIIFAKANLLMIEWLIENNIIFKNYLYLSYSINPFYHHRNNFIMIGIIDINEHPTNINQMINPYMKEIYSITKYMEVMTILSINNKKTYNMNRIESISKLILCDSDEKEVVLDWCC